MPATLTHNYDEITRKIRSSQAATAAQLRYITRLETQALQSEDDRYTFTERLAAALGFVDADGVADETAAKRACESISRDRISHYEATRWIDTLKAMADEPRCPGCGERGSRHPSVRFFDDHYDYSCKLS